MQAIYEKTHACAPRGYLVLSNLWKRVHRGSRMRAPSEAANSLIGRAGDVFNILERKAFARAPCGLIVNLSCASTLTKARERPQRSAKFQDSQAKGMIE